jgi:hypothetical protein
MSDLPKVVFGGSGRDWFRLGDVVINNSDEGINSFGDYCQLVIAVLCAVAGFCGLVMALLLSVPWAIFLGICLLVFGGVGIFCKIVRVILSWVMTIALIILVLWFIFMFVV